jgi:hypothetical protein
MRILKGVLTAGLFLSFAAVLYAQSSEILGEVELDGASSVEKTSGIWIDGQYVGYLKELKGSKKIMLLPGEHLIVVRQDGYKDFAERVVVQPKEKQVVQVAMSKDPAAGNPPAVTAEVKLSVNPDRAGVFVDGLFVGHVGEFGGVGKALLLAPGSHKITIFLSGYQTFETEINLTANQKFQLKTDLVKTAAPQPTPLSDQK